MLSVIIPTHNRAGTLAKCLEMLERQTLDRGLYEIIVVDDGSTDETADVARRFCRADHPVVRYLHQTNAGANAARNRAIRATRSELLLLINDDILATPDMLAAHVAVHDRYPDRSVACLGRVTLLPTLPQSPLAFLHLDRAFARLDTKVEHDWRAFFSCNVSVKRTLLDCGGFFDEQIHYHEDLELSERLSHHGLRVVYCPDALGYHDHHLTEAEFLEIPVREARALAVWARKSPQLRPILGPLGFEPALPEAVKIRHSLAALAVNELTIPFWMRLARSCPRPLHALSRRVYGVIYQAIRRSALRRDGLPGR